MRYLGIDYGTKHIGVAVSDAEEKIAFPHSTILAGKGAVAHVVALAHEKGVQTVVLGESKNFKNEANPVQQDIERFNRALAEAGLRVVYQPEFMTSALADRSGGDDASAAALILQSYLDTIDR